MATFPVIVPLGNKPTQIGIIQQGKLLVNGSTNTVYLSLDSAVYSGGGIPLAGGASIKWEATGSVYAICDTAATAAVNLIISDAASDLTPSSSAIAAAIVAAGLAQQIATDIYNQGILVADLPVSYQDLNANAANPWSYGPTGATRIIDLTQYQSFSAVFQGNVLLTVDQLYEVRHFRGNFLVHTESIWVPQGAHTQLGNAAVSGVVYSGPLYGDTLTFGILNGAPANNSMTLNISFSRRPAANTDYLTASNGGAVAGYSGLGLICQKSGVSGGAGTQISVGWTDVADGYISLSGNGNTAYSAILYDPTATHIYAQLNVSGGWSVLPPIIMPRGPMNLQIFAAGAATPYDVQVKRQAAA